MVTRLYNGFRQNSSENNNKANDPLAAFMNQFSQHFEKVSKEVVSSMYSCYLTDSVL